VISVLRWRFSFGTFDRIASTYFFLLDVSTAQHRRKWQFEVRCGVLCRGVACVDWTYAPPWTVSHLGLPVSWRR
jgi:hypothetical protein